MKIINKRINVGTIFPYFFFILLLIPTSTFAASLSISPATGVYSTGKTFTVTVAVNSAGQPINASDGTITFNPRELTVVAASRSASIFSLWTTEPSFSNTAGTINFSGGSPSGYNGAFGNVLTVTFRTLTSGTAKVSLTGASVLAADGKGTNVLTNMNGGTYTMSAVESQPAPEVIIEYVAPANTPGAPQITSTTNADQTKWSKETTANLAWSLPSDIIAIRTSLDDKASAIPTKVYDSPIKNISLTDLAQGVSYFHIQFKNKDGWGKIANYRLAIDSNKPESFEISLPENADLSNSNQNLILKAVDKTSPVNKFKVQLDGAEAFEFIATSSTSTLPLNNLKPGYHTVVIEAFDSAGNSLINSFSFTISSFEKPVIKDYPQNLTEGVIPVIKGTTRPNSTIDIKVIDQNGVETHTTTNSDAEGKFNYIPDTSFTKGVYTITASAVDSNGAHSEESDSVKIIVEVPGYIKIGTFLINILSIVIPLFALVVLGWLLLMVSIRKLFVMKKKTVIEANEALEILAKEFVTINTVLKEHEADLLSSRKTQKLTQAEEALITSVKQALNSAQTKVQKEITDVTKIFK